MISNSVAYHVVYLDSLVVPKFINRAQVSFRNHVVKVLNAIQQQDIV